MFTAPALRSAFDRVVLQRSFPAGVAIMHPGDTITHIPIVERGSLRILLRDGQGRERFLYHILPGETCAASLTCCVAERSSNVLAVVEEDADLLMVPVRYLDEWMEHPEWRKYVNGMHAQRFQELLDAFEVVAFSKLDAQLWDYLVRRVQAVGDPVLRVTHQEIAQELGSTREVITRLMHQLQQEERISMARGTVTVLPLKR